MPLGGLSSPSFSCVLIGFFMVESPGKALKAGKLRSMKAEILSGHGLDFRRAMYGKPKDRNVFGH